LAAPAVALDEVEDHHGVIVAVADEELGLRPITVRAASRGLACSGMVPGEVRDGRSKG
jgi:hypothetical protein